MVGKGFAKAEDVERISREEMDELKRKDAVKSSAYEDEFTEGPEPETGEDEEEAGPVEEKKKPVSGGPIPEEQARAIFAEGHKAGFAVGYRQARLEIIERLLA